MYGDKYVAPVGVARGRRTGGARLLARGIALPPVGA